MLAPLSLTNSGRCLRGPATRAQRRVQRTRERGQQFAPATPFTEGTAASGPSSQAKVKAWMPPPGSGEDRADKNRSRRSRLQARRFRNAPCQTFQTCALPWKKALTWPRTGQRKPEARDGEQGHGQGPFRQLTVDHGVGSPKAPKAVDRWARGRFLLFRCCSLLFSAVMCLVFVLFPPGRRPLAATNRRTVRGPPVMAAAAQGSHKPLASCCAPLRASVRGRRSLRGGCPMPGSATARRWRLLAGNGLPPQIAGAGNEAGPPAGARSPAQCFCTLVAFDGAALSFRTPFGLLHFLPITNFQSQNKRSNLTSSSARSQSPPICAAFLAATP